LPFEVTGQPVIVESGFTDRNHLRMLCQFDQFSDCRFTQIRVIGMYTDRGIEVVMLFRQRQHFRKILQRHADAERGADIVFTHFFEDRGQVIGEFRKIEVAVRIDEHGQAALRDGFTTVA
jgi:hypothetical protein